jgi:hypothetical protein
MINYRLIWGYMTYQPPPLPDELVEQLRQLTNDADNHQWQVGDFLVSVVDELGQHYEAIGVKRARSWLIQNMASRVGVDASTLRDREAMARFYPANIRSRFDMLTYHQLRACKSAGPEWERYAIWASEDLPPCAVIRAKVKNGGSLPPAWAGRWSRVIELSELLQSDEQAPPGVRLTARLISMGILG